VKHFVFYRRPSLFIAGPSLFVFGRCKALDAAFPDGFGGLSPIPMKNKGSISQR
jgi:hypothetical protein